ncbi:glycoside hydrolase family 16 protein [Undibacterium sp. TC4M20W]|uniref:glycoside hydrolase family 16 protein n=1 Tax=Undibacterium sp. TC4M20W TaxID=3413052 RepID=UPI003BEFA2A1
MKKQISLPACLTYLSLLLLTACGGSSNLVQTQVAPNLQHGWELVWADEFAADKLDLQSWQIETGGHGWGNHELENYTARKENLRLENGMLVIEARQEKFAGSDYTSARIKTAGLREFTYGRFEARIKIPAGQGVWPAFWLLGAEASAAGWPERGEIDIMENIGKEAATSYATLHGPGYYGATGFGGSKKLAQGKLADDFHIYSVEWDATQIRWYLDGQLYHQASPANVPGKWVFDHGFFIILNLAIGGEWPGAPDANTRFPQQMLVDYVRVYKRKT